MENIVIENNEYDQLCQACYNEDNSTVKTIRTIDYSGEIRLCKECRIELISKLKGENSI
jgi:NMD protein affecting ribosome stability and mRNA decay